MKTKPEIKSYSPKPPTHAPTNDVLLPNGIILRDGVFINPEKTTPAEGGIVTDTSMRAIGDGGDSLGVTKKPMPLSQAIEIAIQVIADVIGVYDVSPYKEMEKDKARDLCNARERLLKFKEQDIAIRKLLDV